MVPPSSKDEAPVSYSVSREVPCSVLKCETVLGTLDATPKSPPTRRVPSRGDAVTRLGIKGTTAGVGNPIFLGVESGHEESRGFQSHRKRLTHSGLLTWGLLLVLNPSQHPKRSRGRWQCTRRSGEELREHPSLVLFRTRTGICLFCWLRVRRCCPSHRLK